MSTTTCGQCGAPLRADQPWCSLCFARAPEAFDPLTAPLEELTAPGERPDPQPAPAHATTVGRGRHSADAARAAHPTPTSRSAEVDLPPAEGQLWQPPSWMALPQDTSGVAEPLAAGPAEDDTESEVTDIDVMFSMLSAEHRATDPTAGLADRLDDKSTRMAIMIGGALIVGAVLFMAFTLLGAIF